LFTGIITEIGKIEKIENYNNKRYYTIKCNTMQSDLVLGESIACNGVCLTVTTFSSGSITTEVMNQTFKTTTVPHWKVNSQIHLEKALRLSDRLNGHIVQGHIDTTARLINKSVENNTLYLEFGAVSPFLVLHGSIAIDGVSLTVANLNEKTFQVALIYHTFKNTFFKELNIGEYVNLEFDIIGKYVQRLVGEKNNNNLSEEWLIKNGF